MNSNEDKKTNTLKINLANFKERFADDSKEFLMSIYIQLMIWKLSRMARPKTRLKIF